MLGDVRRRRRLVLGRHEQAISPKDLGLVKVVCASDKDRLGRGRRARFDPERRVKRLRQIALDALGESELVGGIR